MFFCDPKVLSALCFAYVAPAQLIWYPHWTIWLSMVFCESTMDHHMAHRVLPICLLITYWSLTELHDHQGCHWSTAQRSAVIHSTLSRVPSSHNLIIGIIIGTPLDHLHHNQSIFLGISSITTNHLKEIFIIFNVWQIELKWTGCKIHKTKNCIKLKWLAVESSKRKKKTFSEMFFLNFQCNLSYSFA